MSTESTETDEWRPTVLMQSVSEYLERQTDEVRVTAIYRDVRGKRDYLVDAVRFLVGDGWATERAGNRGSRLMRSNQAVSRAVPTRPPDTGSLDPSPRSPRL